MSRRDITIVVTAHDEGRLAHRTMHSLSRGRAFAARHGVTTDVVVVLDRASPETHSYFERHGNPNFKPLIADYGDLAESRNAGVRAADGDLIAFLDADDLFGETWLYEAHKAASSRAGPSVVHPEYTLCFENQVLVAEHRSSESALFSIPDLLENNCWTSIVLAPRELLIQIPFRCAPMHSGFGYEDWHWFCEVLARGIPVLTAPACAFVRRKHVGSMLEHYNRLGAVIRPTRLFAPDVFGHCVKPTNEPKKSELQHVIRKLAKSLEGPLTRVVKRTVGTRPRARLFLAEARNSARSLWSRSFSAQVGESLPPWLLSEWKAIDAVEPGVFPGRDHVRTTPLYRVPRSRLGQRYLDLWAACGEDHPTHVFLLPWLQRGGADVEALNYVRAVAGYPNARVVVIATENAPSPWAARLSGSVRFVDFGVRHSDLTAAERDRLLTRLLLQRPPRVIHNLNSSLGYELFTRYGRALRDQSRLYVSAFCDDYSPDGRSTGYSFRHLPACIDVLTCVAADNEAFLRILADTFAFDPAKLAVHYQPVELGAAPWGVARRRGDVLHVLWAGRLDRQKRVDVLAGIAKASQHLPIQFHVYGAPHLDRDPALRDLGGLGNTTMYGAYDGFASLPVRAMDCFLYTSAWDGLPNVLLEAIASGLPVVAPAVGGIPELVKPNETGFLVDPPDDVAQFVAALQAIRSGGESIRKMAASARAVVERRHSWGSFVRSLERFPGYLTFDVEASTQPDDPQRV